MSKYINPRKYKDDSRLHKEVSYRTLKRVRVVKKDLLEYIRSVRYYLNSDDFIRIGNNKYHWSDTSWSFNINTALSRILNKLNRLNFSIKKAYGGASVLNEDQIKSFYKLKDESDDDIFKEILLDQIEQVILDL